MGRTTQVLALAAMTTLFACADGGESDRPIPGGRVRDSLIGASQLPGARGVRGALRAQDSARARSARIDSIADSDPP